MLSPQYSKSLLGQITGVNIKLVKEGFFLLKIIHQTTLKSVFQFVGFVALCGCSTPSFLEYQ